MWAQNNFGSALTTKVNASNIANITYKDLIHITYFNFDLMDHYATKCPEPKRNVSEDKWQS